MIFFAQVSLHMLSVCVPERGCGEGLHGVEVGEEERHGEGGGEHDERQEEPAVARREEGAVLEEGEEARWRRSGRHGRLRD